MVIEKRGTVVIELYPKDAPKTVTHFLDLVNKKFYDGILFHRVVKSGIYVAQAGDPKSKTVNGALLADIPSEEVGQKYGLGAGGSGKTVPLEARRPHDRGTLGLARSQDPNSGDSQFYFNLEANHQLDGEYCVFGKVVKGMEALGKIRQGDRIKSVRVVGAAKGRKAEASEDGAEQTERAVAQAQMPPDAPSRDPALEKFKEGAIRATLEIENRGAMTLELYPKAAPKTVEHIVALARKGFYDGIKFHRVVPGFVIQAGDPESKEIGPEAFESHQVGTHGSGKMVPLEANLSNLQDSLGLARAQDPNSGDSQFYINLADNTPLDGQYCVFGRIVRGADIAPKVRVGDRITRLRIADSGAKK
jgi:cyclophilin family peptidyl-prolyl cis-trans isomerase